VRCRQLRAVRCDGVLRWFAHTVYAVDPDHVFQNRRALIWRLPVQQNPVCLYSCQRNEGRNGDFEAEDLHQLLDWLGEDLVCAICDPKSPVNTCTSISLATATRTRKAQRLCTLSSGILLMRTGAPPHCSERHRAASTARKRARKTWRQCQASSTWLSSPGCVFVKFGDEMRALRLHAEAGRLHVDTACFDILAPAPHEQPPHPAIVLFYMELAGHLWLQYAVVDSGVVDQDALHKLEFLV
jgi:hypothetical protein